MKKELTSFSIKARLKSFLYAFEGVSTFFLTQHNAIIHLFMTIAAFAAAILFRVSKTEIIAITVVVGFVWAAEFFNTAIEKLADLASKEIDSNIKFIKDVSAAAVLFSALAAFITGALIFVPKLLQ